MFLNLRPKYSDSTHAPRTIIGKDYPTSIQGSVGQHQFFTAIQRSDKDYEVTEAAVPYGPFYRAWDEEMWKILKEKSWAHILATSGTSEQETVRLYLEAVQEVEIESRQLYGGDDSMDFCGDNYKWMMIIDGCFLLQVALAVLNGGGPEQVGHLRDFRMVIPPGERWQKKHPENQERGQNSTPSTMLKLAVSSMFIVGNQIPRGTQSSDETNILSKLH